MSHTAAGNGEFAKVVANHFGLDVDFDEVLSVVNGDATTYELWEDGHVSAVGADGLGCRPFHPCEEMLVLSGQTAAEAAANS